MAPQGLRLRRLPVGVVLFAVATGCSTPSTALRGTSPEWMREGIAQGLPVEDPLVLGPEAKEEIKRRASQVGSERSQMSRLLRFLVDQQGLAFHYRPARTLTAADAFAQREGDCMSYAMLYVAAARSLGLHVHFVRITEIPVYWEEDGHFFTSSHIAVAHGHDTWVGEAMVVDFSASHTSAWRFSLYEEMDDDSALVLFHNNRAVELLLAGHTDEAEQLLRFLLTRATPMPEVYNNLGIVLSRKGRAQEATELYSQAIERFPRFIPLYSNAMSAAARAGRPDLSERWVIAGRKIAQSDPAFNFSEGMLAFKRRDFAVAADHFEQALDVQPDELTLLAWTARAHFAAGELSRGQTQVERIRRQKPSESQRTLLGDLQREFPGAGIQLAEAPALSYR
jgi:tetratricopeptide (TPR) repeat protein